MAYLRGMTKTVTATGFDTLTYARRLKAAGVDEAQAEAHAEAVRDAVTEGVATKADLASLETRVTVRLYGGLLATVAAVVALIKLLP